MKVVGESACDHREDELKTDRQYIRKRERERERVDKIKKRDEKIVDVLFQRSIQVFASFCFEILIG
jgi:hypothetical protein